MVLTTPLFSQTAASKEKVKPNLEVFYSLVDSAANAAGSYIPNEKNIAINFDFGNTYSVFGNQIIKALTDMGKNIKFNSPGSDSAISINFVIDRAQVNYGAIYRKVLFGDYYTSRAISLGGNFVIMQPKVIMKNFTYNYIDTVEVKDIRELENPSFPFTQSQLPAEPFFSSAYEPIIAVGAAALTVILFYTVRSK